MRTYKLSEIIDFRDVMNIDNREKFVAEFAKKVEGMIFLEHAMRQMCNPMNVGDETLISHYDLTHLAAQEWRLCCYCFDDVCDIKRCQEILVNLRFIANCKERLEKLRKGTFCQFVRNHKMRTIVRQHIDRADSYVSAHEIFNLAVYKFHNEGWGNADDLREDLLHFI